MKSIQIKSMTREILLSPAKDGADRLIILSGYASPTMVSWLMKNLKTTKSTPVTIELFIGMTAIDGISTDFHNGFLALMRNNQIPKTVRSFSCSYLFQNPVHSSVYLWMKNDIPYKAYAGSAYFTQASFCLGQDELMTEYDPYLAKRYIDQFIGSSIYCNHSEIEENVQIRGSHPIYDDLRNAEVSGLILPEGETITLSLLARNNEIGETSGLNWGHRKNKRYKRNINEAYIPLPRIVAKSGFFPLNKNHFFAITDDKKTLVLRVEQEGDKAITTPLCNACLGEYFRNRLDLANGAFVTKADLERYGRTDVTFVKIDNEQYFMDFSV